VPPFPFLGLAPSGDEAEVEGRRPVGEEGGALSPGLAHRKNLPQFSALVHTQKPRPLLGPSFFVMRHAQGLRHTGQATAGGAMRTPPHFLPDGRKGTLSLSVMCDCEE
jgi:hypothetical protein